MDYVNLTTSERVKILMNRKGVTLNHLASHLGITPQALSWTIRNNRWKIERMKVVAKCLGVKLSSLMQ
jgi:transcriptional regulator with XRE-family HTH domain